MEIAEALKASKDGRLPSDYYGEATGNLGESKLFTNLFTLFINKTNIHNTFVYKSLHGIYFTQGR